jgi:hypothetical protein
MKHVQDGDGGPERCGEHAESDERVAATLASSDVEVAAPGRGGGLGRPHDLERGRRRVEGGAGDDDGLCRPT